MNKEVNIYDFKTNFSSYLAAAQAGEISAFSIKKYDKIVGTFKFEPASPPPSKMPWGAFSGAMSKEDVEWMTSKEADAMILDMFEDSED